MKYPSTFLAYFGLLFTLAVTVQASAHHNGIHSSITARMLTPRSHVTTMQYTCSANEYRSVICVKGAR
jgi:hypothetical protein